MDDLFSIFLDLKLRYWTATHFIPYPKDDCLVFLWPMVQEHGICLTFQPFQFVSKLINGRTSYHWLIL